MTGPEYKYLTCEPLDEPAIVRIMLQEWHHFFCGMEYFAHPWEFGPRKAKELLLTGDSMDAQEACGIGMVSKIFPADELQDSAVAFARRDYGLADQPTGASRREKPRRRRGPGGLAE